MLTPDEERAQSRRRMIKTTVLPWKTWEMILFLAAVAALFLGIWYIDNAPPGSATRPASELQSHWSSEGR